MTPEAVPYRFTGSPDLLPYLDLLTPGDKKQNPALQMREQSSEGPYDSKPRIEPRLRPHCTRGLLSPTILFSTQHLLLVLESTLPPGGHTGRGGNKKHIPSGLPTAQLPHTECEREGDDRVGDLAQW